jgi:hypothetical protein
MVEIVKIAINKIQIFTPIIHFSIPTLINVLFYHLFFTKIFLCMRANGKERKGIEIERKKWSEKIIKKKKSVLFIVNIVRC